MLVEQGVGLDLLLVVVLLEVVAVRGNRVPHERFCCAAARGVRLVRWDCGEMRLAVWWL